MKFENTEVFNFKGAFRGMRNPKESWGKSDSSFGFCGEDEGIEKGMAILRRDNGWCEYAQLGPNDLKLAQSLIKAGSEHRKFMRQIFVSVDITAPLYWWKEFSTYKVGTVENSTSTMHKLADTPITKECFEMDYFEDIDVPLDCGANVYNFYHFWKNLIIQLEWMRQKYNETKEKLNNRNLTESEKKHLNSVAKRYWKELIRLLPASWLQKRTVTLDYENLLAMCSKGQRRFHKLTEWSRAFIEWARSLPYAQELIFLDELEE